jgi:recombination protein RecA
VEVVGALAIDPNRRRDDEPAVSSAPAVSTVGIPSRRPAEAFDERAIPTGFGALDAILGLGGLPRAAATSLHGTGSSGKTTLALRAVAQAQAAGALVAYLDLARSLDPVEAVARGVHLDWLVVLTPESLAEAMSMAAMLLQDRTVDLLLLDLPNRPFEAGSGTGISAATLAERFGRLTALARRAGVQLLVLEPPNLPPALAGVLTQVAALRLELSHRAWIRLGRDVVGQRTEVRVSRDRFGPPGRAAELRILYADGGLRDACLARSDLLWGTAEGVRPAEPVEATRRFLAGAAPPGIAGPAAPPRTVRPSPPPSPQHLFSVSVDATPPSPLASSASPSGAQPVLHALRGGADRSGREAVD